VVTCSIEKELSFIVSIVVPTTRGIMVEDMLEIVTKIKPSIILNLY
jgi:hypothetical protein